MALGPRLPRLADYQLIKLFQKKDDQPHAVVSSPLKKGAVYGVEAAFEKEKRPIFYLSRFDYDPDLNSWTRLPGPADIPTFNFPRWQHSGFKIESKELVSLTIPKVSVSIPRSSKLKERYWGLERVVFTETDLVSVNSRSAIKRLIVEPLKSLPEMDHPA